MCALCVGRCAFSAQAAFDYPNELRGSVISHERLLFHLAYHGHEFGAAGTAPTPTLAASIAAVRSGKAKLTRVITVRV